MLGFFAVEVSCRRAIFERIKNIIMTSTLIVLHVLPYVSTTPFSNINDSSPTGAEEIFQQHGIFQPFDETNNWNYFLRSTLYVIITYTPKKVTRLLKHDEKK